MKKLIITLVALFVAIVVTTVIIICCSEPEIKPLLKQTVTKYGNNKTIVDYEYDENGKLLSENTKYTGGYEATNKVTYEYDENNRVVTKTTEFNESLSNKETFTYNENGDTLTYIGSYFIDGSWEVTQKKMYTYDDDGKLSHKYICNRDIAEGECEIDDDYINMLIDLQYDPNGNIVSRTSYDPDYDHSGYIQLDISDKTSGSFSAEFEDYVHSNVLGAPTKETYTYNAQGKLASIKYNGKLLTSFTYDANGNILKKHTDEAFDEEFKYDDAGRMVMHKTSYSGSDSNTKTYKYNEKGDTLEIIEISNFSGTKNLNSKTRYEYSPETGKLATKYVFSLTDECGYDSAHFDKYTYNEDGTIAKHISLNPNYEKIGDYNAVQIMKNFDGDGATEFKYYMIHFYLENGTSTTFSYINIEQDTSFFGSIKKWFSNLFGGKS